MAFEESSPGRGISRRSALKLGITGLVASEVALVSELAKVPSRIARAGGTPSDIQFNIGDFIDPVQLVNGIPFQFGPVFTYFTPARLTRNPTKTDQSVLAAALNRIEDFYSWSPDGIFTFVSYGIPYFNKLPGGFFGSLVTNFMPRLLSDQSRFALEEAVPSPTDVSSVNPNIVKRNFNIGVRIEGNDVLFTLRSDSTGRLNDVLGWLQGDNTLGGFFVPSPDFGGLFSWQTTRLMFQQPGLPRQVAFNNNLWFAGRVRDTSPMWMSFADQQVSGSGPAQICTFAGNSSAHLTNKVAGNYFDNGSIQHLSHVVLDLGIWYADATQDPPEGEPYLERVQYMFRSNPPPNFGFTDQFTNGGGPAFLENVFNGTGDAALNAQGIGTLDNAHRMGHLTALQRSSRASDSTPIHMRMDGPGFSSMDVPNVSRPFPALSGSVQPKLQFTVFIPTANFFRVMRIRQASLDLVSQFGVEDEDNGLERFTTATRRQNFLIPPRRHRAFPLVEFT